MSLKMFWREIFLAKFSPIAFEMKNVLKRKETQSAGRTQFPGKKHQKIHF